MRTTLSLLLIAAPLPAAGPPVKALPAAGLVVHVGSTDGALEAALAADGRRLVHGLARTDEACSAARAAVRAKGLYGLASVERWHFPPALPYADQLANGLVADLDALGESAPKRDELLRVLAPGGVALLRTGGTWEQVIRPRPADVDEWTHFDHGPDANGVSHDKRVRQPNFIQWVSGVQAIKLGGNPAGFVNLTGVRAADGRVVFDYTDDTNPARRKSMLHARDAFSGVPLWTVPRDLQAGFRRWQLVAAGGRVFTPVRKGGPLVALDGATGEPAVTFEAAGPIPQTPPEAVQVRVAGPTVLLNAGDTLYAMDAGTGKLKWKYTDEAGGLLLFPSADVANNRAFVLAAPDDARPQSRWPWAPARAVVCLELGTGKVVWRNTEVEGKPVGQLVAAGDLLGLFCGSAIGGRDAKEGGGWVSALRAADGKRLGEGTFKVAWNDSMYNAVARDGKLYYAGHTSIYEFDPGPGTITRRFNTGYNQRCNRLCATDDLFICGYVTYLGPDFSGTLQSAARAGCALGATPANGLVYFTPSACNCFTQLRGYLAMSPEAVRDPVPDDRRLVAGSGGPETVVAAAAPAGPVADDWKRQPDRATTAETPAADLGGGRSVVAVIHEHRVEARAKDGAVQWSYTAGGRVSQTPLVRDGLVIFGSHDGWVHAVPAADGTPAWRYLAAPYERKLSAYGQLESSWPVYGVVLHRGLVWASAGLHPELGGGVAMAGLDPKTGKAARRLVLHKPPAHLETTAGKTKGVIVPRSFLNDVPKVAGDQLDVGGFTFDPTADEAELQRRLNTNPPKKK